jgi:hypothetical protein
MPIPGWKEETLRKIGSDCLGYDFLQFSWFKLRIMSLVAVGIEFRMIESYTHSMRVYCCLSKFIALFL